MRLCYDCGTHLDYCFILVHGPHGLCDRGAQKQLQENWESSNQKWRDLFSFCHYNKRCIDLKSLQGAAMIYSLQNKTFTDLKLQGAASALFGAWTGASQERGQGSVGDYPHQVSSHDVQKHFYI